MDYKIQPGVYYNIREDGKWEIYLDATMTGTFGTCQQMFKYAFVDSLTQKGDHFFARDLGSWWSAVMENTYNAFYKGAPLSNIDLINMAMAQWGLLKVDELEKHKPKQYKEFGGRYGAMQMISEYADRQLPIDYKTWKIIAAEASFGRQKEVCIGETDKIILYWMGQPDLFVIFNNRVMPVDHKSIAYIDSNTERKYKPHIQIPGYIIAGQILCKSLGLDLPVDRAVINCVARSDRTDKTGESKHPRFKRIFLSYTPDELEEWRRRRLHQAEALRHAFETNHWSWNEYACNNFFMRPCQFQRICSKTPAFRPIEITSDFIKRPHWIPGKTEKEEEKKSDE